MNTIDFVVRKGAGEYTTGVPIFTKDAFGNNTTITDNVVIDTVSTVSINADTIGTDGSANVGTPGSSTVGLMKRSTSHLRCAVAARCATVRSMTSIRWVMKERLHQ